jgi:Cd2+/Zn2+-exporting ATPase
MKTTLSVPAMDCAVEEAAVRRTFEKVPEVESLSFDLSARRVEVTHTFEDSTPLIKALRGVALESSEVDCDSCAVEHGHGGKWSAWPLAVGLALGLGAEVVHILGDHKIEWVEALVALAAILIGGIPTLKKGWLALTSLTLNMNFLMSIAVVGAFAIGMFSEAAVVVVLFAIAETIEAYSLDRARNSVRKLMELAPDEASVKSPDGEWVAVAAQEVPLGSIVRALAGERIAFDGVVTVGDSAVNQSPITGESMPVEKTVGDEVFAGSINESGRIEYKVTGNRGNTTLDRIITTVQEAQGQRAPTQRFVDSFARVYTPIVFALALLVAVVPPLAFAEGWREWIYKSLVLLVIACPCALVISTPVTIVSGLTAAARRGILIKGGKYLEQGRFLKCVALDKTGTLTFGSPKVQRVEPIGLDSRDRILQIAASLDLNSHHPIAKAIVKAHAGEALPVAEFEELPGRGVTGVVEGKRYWLGNHRLIEERGVCSDVVENVLGRLESEALTAVSLADAERVIGVIGAADELRQTSIEAIQSLKELGVTVLMLTGDNEKTAAAISEKTGLDEFKAEMLPEDKLNEVESLLQRFGHVGMVGDGINDAPALARSSVGFAMGAAGTDVALETADVALMSDDLRGVPNFIRLSKATATILVQNITFAIGIKVVFFVLAMTGTATLWMAVFADLGASLLVIGNSLRVLPSR